MGVPGGPGPSHGARAAKRARPHDHHEQAAAGNQYDEYSNDIRTHVGGPEAQIDQWAFKAATQGTEGPGGPNGMGSAWAGQHQSLATDAFVHHDFTSMKDDIHQTISTSSHLMGQGGNICDTWTAVPAFSDVLEISMGMFNGNQLMGGANMFNQYYLCKLKGFKIIFKDIIVALEASTNVGLTTMADVTTEWRRRPRVAKYNSAQPPLTDLPDPAQYPDWWQDWRPATDGAVSFGFPVDSRRVPTFMANAMRPTNIPGGEDPRIVTTGVYRTLRQFLYGVGTNSQFTDTAPNQPGDIVNVSLGAAALELTAYTWEFMDYFFEWRARNCPNSTSGTNTSARYNIQIDSVWEMSHRVTTPIITRFSGTIPGSLMIKDEDDDDE